MGYRQPGVASDGPAGAPARRGKGKVTIVYEDTTDDVLVPAPPGKTLKINVDLMLWRCRQARLAALLVLDEEERRRLFREAEAGLRRCLVLDSADPRTYVVLGKLYMVQRRYDEARALYAEGCTNTGNTNPYIWSAWGWLEFKTGNVSRARQLFDAATVVDDTHACAWHKWGLLEKSEGNYLRARDLWMQGIQRCKRKPQAQNAYLFNALAVMAAELQRVEEARAWFEEGTRTMEGAASVALWQAWGVLEAKQGDPYAVRYLFKKALQANGRSRYVHLAWALWERRNGNLLACLELLRRGQAMNPTDAALYQVRALVEWRDRGNVEVAQQCFQAGVRADPRHLPVWQAWGCMEAELGNVDRARELFQQGVWSDPRSKDTKYVLHAWGCLERGQGNLQLARELFKAAIKVDPKAEKVWYTWIAMEEDAGFLERADELRIRQAEQQWEFEVPAGFTTRPGGMAAAAAGAAASAQAPLTALKDMLSRFFSARDASLSGSSSSTAASKPGPGSARSFLPADYEADMPLEEALLFPEETRTQAQQQQRRPRRAAAAAVAGADAAALALGTAVGATSDEEGMLVLPPPNTQLLQALNTGGELYSESSQPQLQAVELSPRELIQLQGAGDPPPPEDLLQPALQGLTPGAAAAVTAAAKAPVPRPVRRREAAAGLAARPVRRPRPVPPTSSEPQGGDTDPRSSPAANGKEQPQP